MDIEPQTKENTQRAIEEALSEVYTALLPLGYEERITVLRVLIEHFGAS